MKQIFKVEINGKFAQYLMKSETKLITQLYETGKIIKLTCIEVTAQEYKILFGK